MPWQPSLFSLRKGAAALHSGGIVACPTEAVWGLSCDPFDEAAVESLLYLKCRDRAKGLLLVAAAESQLDWLLHDLPSAARARLALSWPGPSTWLVPHQNRVPSWICGRHSTVAVRVSAHPGLVALCEAWGGAMVSTSANPSGCLPALYPFQLRRYFGNGLAYIMPGPVGTADRPSIIKDLMSDELIRS